MTHPYTTERYAESLLRNGHIVRVPEWGCCVLVRPILGQLRMQPGPTRSQSLLRTLTYRAAYPVCGHLILYPLFWSSMIFTGLLLNVSQQNLTAFARSRRTFCTSLRRDHPRMTRIIGTKLEGLADAWMWRS